MSGLGAFEAEVNVSRETLQRLKVYAGLLEKWNPSINLVAKSTLPDLWARHFLDSTQILHLAPHDAGKWVDIGTGGGFPGLVIAIMADVSRPGLRVTCVESDQRKATFLRTVVRETGISADVVAQRIEDLDPMCADVVSARALAPLVELVGYADRHLREGGTAIFPKGAGYRAEVSQALEKWFFQMDTYPSKTDPQGNILKLGEIHRV